MKNKSQNLARLKFKRVVVFVAFGVEKCTGGRVIDQLTVRLDGGKRHRVGLSFRVHVNDGVEAENRLAAEVDKGAVGDGHVELSKIVKRVCDAEFQCIAVNDRDGFGGNAIHGEILSIDAGKQHLPGERDPVSRRKVEDNLTIQRLTGNHLECR